MNARHATPRPSAPSAAAAHAAELARPTDRTLSVLTRKHIARFARRHGRDLDKLRAMSRRTTGAVTRPALAAALRTAALFLRLTDSHRRSLAAATLANPTAESAGGRHPRATPSPADSSPRLLARALVKAPGAPGANGHPYAPAPTRAELT